MPTDYTTAMDRADALSLGITVAAARARREAREAKAAARQTNA